MDKINYANEALEKFYAQKLEEYRKENTQNKKGMMIYIWFGYLSKSLISYQNMYPPKQSSPRSTRPII